jgi:hypothetical protein
VKSGDNLSNWLAGTSDCIGSRRKMKEWTPVPIDIENTAQFRYLGMTVTYQNLIQEEIKRRLNSGNACYHSVQNLFSTRLLSKVTVKGKVVPVLN